MATNDARDFEKQLEALDVALENAARAARALAGMFRDAEDNRASDALEAYLIPALKAWRSNEEQCGGLVDAEQSVARLVADGVVTP